jgi:hypothetical protein
MNCLCRSAIQAENVLSYKSKDGKGDTIYRKMKAWHEASEKNMLPETLQDCPELPERVDLEVLETANGKIIFDFTDLDDKTEHLPKMDQLYNRMFYRMAPVLDKIVGEIALENRAAIDKKIEKDAKKAQKRQRCDGGGDGVSHTSVSHTPSSHPPGSQTPGSVFRGGGHAAAGQRCSPAGSGAHTPPLLRRFFVPNQPWLKDAKIDVSKVVFNTPTKQGDVPLLGGRIGGISPSAVQFGKSGSKCSSRWECHQLLSNTDDGSSVGVGLQFFKPAKATGAVAVGYWCSDCMQRM